MEGASDFLFQLVSSEKLTDNFTLGNTHALGFGMAAVSAGTSTRTRRQNE
jgi:hypothetical protein